MSARATTVALAPSAPRSSQRLRRCVPPYPFGAAAL